MAGHVNLDIDHCNRFDGSCCVFTMAHKKDCSSGIEDPAADVSLMPDLSEGEKKQLLEVMQRAKVFTYT